MAGYDHQIANWAVEADAYYQKRDAIDPEAKCRDCVNFQAPPAGEWGWCLEAEDYVFGEDRPWVLDYECYEEA